MSAASDGDARPQAAVSVPPLPRPPVEEFRMNASSPQLGALGGTSGFSSSTSSLPKPVLSLSPPTATTTTTTSTSTTTTTAAPALPSLSATPSLGGSSSNATISPRPRGGPLRLRALGSNSASTSSLPTVTRSRWTVQSLQPITVHSGFLTKKGGRGLQQNWRKRWFVLTSDKRLFYFASQRDADPKGIIDLDKYNEVVEVEGTWPRVHRFNLLNTDSRLSIRTFFLVSASKAENDEWMAKIMSIISGKEQPKLPPRISVFDVHAVRRPPSSVYDGGAKQELYVALKVQLGLEKLVKFYAQQHESTLLARTQRQLDEHAAAVARLRESAVTVPELPKMLSLAETTSFHPLWLPPLPKSQARKLAYVLL